MVIIAIHEGANSRGVARGARPPRADGRRPTRSARSPSDGGSPPRCSGWPRAPARAASGVTPDRPGPPSRRPRTATDVDPTPPGQAQSGRRPGPIPTTRVATAARPGPLHPTRHATAAKAPRRPKEPAPAPEGLRPPPPGAALDAAPGRSRRVPGLAAEPRRAAAEVVGRAHRPFLSPYSFLTVCSTTWRAKTAMGLPCTAATTRSIWWTSRVKSRRTGLVLGSAGVKACRIFSSHGRSASDA
jgi:hypothetical protein